MAPLPQNNTTRLFLDYTSMGVPHTLMVRIPSSATPTQIEQFATNLSDALRNRMLTSDAFLSARVSNAGSNFSLPITFVPAGGVLASAGNIWGQDPESTFVSIVGRSIVSGRKNRLEYFNPITTTSWPDDNRYNPGEAAPIDTFRINVINVLNGGGSSGVAAVAIDGTDATWYPYVNIAQNAYWQRKQRRSA